MWVGDVYRITPRELIVVGQVVVAPRELLPLGRIDLVAPRELFVRSPVRDVAEENAFGSQKTDWIGQADQVQVAPRKLTWIEDDARQLQDVQQPDPAAVVQAILQLARIPE